METVPPEIWTEVFAFACTDDGSTGRALSTVSRTVHLISKPLKYQSICVVSPNQLLRLLTALAALSPSARKIKYLFANLDRSKDSGGNTEIHRDAHADPSTDITEEALFQILHLASSSLRALHIYHTKIHRQSLLLEMDLPVLSELTLHGPFKAADLAHLRPRALFPSLRKMHIHHFAYHPTNFLNQIARAAPLLTHLRVPQRSFSLYDIQVALGILQPAVSSPDAAQLPGKLEKLVIELEPIPTSLDSWASNIRGEQFVRKLQKISDSDERVFLVDGGSYWMPVAQAKEEWLENVRRPAFSGVCLR
ncbi:hypothetical protein DFH09DRAFT_276192 [Mycena vulgaris]|nr:hypothetical protein DFH09DRAFT_276192 [Mycena vulgaris]